MLPVKKMMRGTGELVVTRPETSIRKTVRMMVENRVGSVIVAEFEKVVGIVTDRDVLMHLAGEKRCDIDRERIDSIMTKTIHSIGPTADVEKAVDMMVKYKIKKLPVVEDGKIVGIVTSTDIMSDQSDVMTRLRKVLYNMRNVKRRMLKKLE